MDKLVIIYAAVAYWPLSLIVRKYRGWHVLQDGLLDDPQPPTLIGWLSFSASVYAFHAIGSFCLETFDYEMLPSAQRNASTVVAPTPSTEVVFLGILAAAWLSFVGLKLAFASPPETEETKSKKPAAVRRRAATKRSSRRR